LLQYLLTEERRVKEVNVRMKSPGDYNKIIKNKNKEESFKM